MARGAHGDRSVLGADCACSMLMGWTLWRGRMGFAGSDLERSCYVGMKAWSLVLGKLEESNVRAWMWMGVQPKCKIQSEN